MAEGRGEEWGFSTKIIYAAAHAVGVVKYQEGGCWWWKLPA
jgi:hypothetical protein